MVIEKSSTVCSALLLVVVLLDARVQMLRFCGVIDVLLNTGTICPFALGGVLLYCTGVTLVMLCCYTTKDKTGQSSQHTIKKVVQAGKLIYIYFLGVGFLGR